MPDERQQKLEAMSTKELCAFLERDLELDSDPSQMMAATEILAQREPGAVCDVDAAWKTFCEEYRPFQGDTAPLLEGDDVPCSEILAQDKGKTQTSKRVRRRIWHPCMYSAAAAAVAAVILLHGAPQNTARPEDPNRELIEWNSRYLTQWIPRPDTLTVGKAVTKSSDAESTTQNASYGSNNTTQDEWSRSAADSGTAEPEEELPATFSTASAGDVEEPVNGEQDPIQNVEDAGSAGTQGGSGETVLPSDDSIFADAIKSDEENTTTNATAPQE